jgi:hypothetical protein
MHIHKQEYMKNKILVLYIYTSGPGSSVGIATGYGLDDSEIESSWAHPVSYTMGTGSFPGLNRPGRGADYPPPPSAEVENE